jgi:hypothetical protein
MPILQSGVFGIKSKQKMQKIQALPIITTDNDG